MSPFKAGAIAVVLIALVTYFAFTKENPFASPYELNARVRAAPTAWPSARRCGSRAWTWARS